MSLWVEATLGFPGVSILPQVPLLRVTPGSKGSCLGQCLLIPMIGSLSHVL